MGVVLLQFIYDSSGVGRGIGAWLCVCLGTWHPYKQANTVVWCHWAARFIAPFFNHLVPKSNFRKKARLVSICSFLTYIRLAAPSFATQLHDAIKAARKMPSKPLILAYLLDLRDLLHFAIPVVACVKLAAMSIAVTPSLILMQLGCASNRRVWQKECV